MIGDFSVLQKKNSLLKTYTKQFFLKNIKNVSPRGTYIWSFPYINLDKYLEHCIKNISVLLLLFLHLKCWGMNTYRIILLKQKLEGMRVWTCFLCMTHCLMVVIFSVKLFQNPSRYDIKTSIQTENTTSKCLPFHYLRFWLQNSQCCLYTLYN